MPGAARHRCTVGVQRLVGRHRLSSGSPGVRAPFPLWKNVGAACIVTGTERPEIRARCTKRNVVGPRNGVEVIGLETVILPKANWTNIVFGAPRKRDVIAAGARLQRSDLCFQESLVTNYVASDRRRAPTRSQAVQNCGANKPGTDRGTVFDPAYKPLRGRLGMFNDDRETGLVVGRDRPAVGNALNHNRSRTFTTKRHTRFQVPADTPQPPPSRRAPARGPRLASHSVACFRLGNSLRFSPVQTTPAGSGPSKTMTKRPPDGRIRGVHPASIRSRTRVWSTAMVPLRAESRRSPAQHRNHLCCATYLRIFACRLRTAVPDHRVLADESRHPAAYLDIPADRSRSSAGYLRISGDRPPLHNYVSPLMGFGRRRCAEKQDACL
ncbi:uncharacterized protein SOCE836_027340 [Sorangium cellulosum]|uniref:Uncharacterized protein n=1 Tax=Sorangium cellulosum TaxID=56 RepID=A0A4P2QL11_SORCE|nr:uncharacterized protein SOCE836_027340 [Sorangium cellulosum]WCQ90016.1 hypothetical protein NQZ70_02715 [Sorangium sp. Soce836]